MRNNAFIEHKKTLKALKKELDAELRRRGGIEIETAADPVDQLLNQLERDSKLDTLSRMAEQYRLVSAALARLTSGDYGDCLECGEEIPARRLQAVPWAPLCLACQERAERSQEHQAGVPVLTAAA